MKNLNSLMFSLSLDTNECETSNGGCTENSYCINTLGSFECQCERGYEMMTDGCTG